ncbi:MAG: exodeoxyribonuclease VII large subunit [Eubacterium sp.]|nr:exodeoxyribonuclease VII large subunit [Eubacterium sp.]
MNVLTVSQINTFIKAVFAERQELRNVYISGEISNFTHYYRSGHMYFTLKDENAQIKAVMFSSYASRLKFQPESGMKVICRGYISVYEKSGEYQLYVDDMQPDGLGALNLAYEQLKAKLFAEGVCGDDVKKPLPRYPRKIGVVTSDIGAAVEDIKNITARRWPLAKVVIAPTLVQGANAAPDIVKSIVRLDNAGDIDVIIVGRGGGSVEDLWAFNTEGVARAIINCKTPIVSAVGHETDFTICDFVADLRAPTPSAAAEIICPDIEAEIAHFENLKNMLSCLESDKIDEEMQYIADLTETSVLASSENFLKEHCDYLGELSSRFCRAFDSTLGDKENKFAMLLGKLNALSPLAVMQRGYAVAKESGGKIIKSVSQISANDDVKIEFADGNAVCKVCEVNQIER